MDRPEVAFREHPDIVQMQAGYDRAGQSVAVQSVAGFALLAGVYLAISPWVIGFRAAATDLRVTDLICGIAVALLAAGYASAYGRTHGLAWVTAVIGAWTVVAQWVVLGSNVAAGAIVSNVITGGVLLLLGIAMTVMAAAPSRVRGGAS